MLRRLINNWWVGLVSVGLLLAALIGAATAQETSQVTISVSPPTFELSANPGERLENSFRIINGTDSELTLSTAVKNFTAEGEEGAVNLTDDDTGFSLASWISVNPETAILPPRGSQTFAFSIDVPDNAEPGGHFGSVIVSTNPVQIDSTGAAVSQEAGPLILLGVAGDVDQSAKIVSFAAQKGFWEKGPVVLETRIANEGNVHFKPSGTIAVKNMFGREITRINLEERNVLPDTTRKLLNEWSPGFAVGRYTADLSVVFGQDQNVETASATFVIFPYKIIVPILLGLILLIVLLVRGRQRLSAAGRALAGKR